MIWLSKIIGIALIMIASFDILVTVLYPRNSKSLLSLPLSKLIWRVFRQISRWSNSILPLSYCGSIILIVIASVWNILFVVGFAFVFWPDLGWGIEAGQGQTPTDFGTAFYYSGFNFTTLGVGDLVPNNTVTRLTTILEASLGFATFTVTLTYLLSVLNSLTRRNIFALSLHHRTARKDNAAELLLAWALDNNFCNARADITNMARDLLYLVESHHSYPILHYFRFEKKYYSLAQMMLVTLDTVTLIKSALHQKEHRSLINSIAVTELQSGGLYLLRELADCFLSERIQKTEDSKSEWRRWYYYVVKRLRDEGIKTPEDIEAGADLYVSLRQEWNSDVSAFANKMELKWSDIRPEGRII